MPNLAIAKPLFVGALLGVLSLLVACGSKITSELDATERDVFERFVSVDVAALDEQGLNDLLALRKELTSGTAALKMSVEETEKTTAQIEALIEYLTPKVQAETNKKKKQTLGRELYELRKAIGRGGA